MSLREGQESIVSGLPMRMKHAAPAVNAIQARSWLLKKTQFTPDQVNQVFLDWLNSVV